MLDKFLIGYIKTCKNYEDMSNLSKGLRDKLSNSFDITTLNTLVKQTSSDGTIKFLFQLYDGYSIETVLMRHEYGNSICVTTQVGCRMYVLCFDTWWIKAKPRSWRNRSASSRSSACA